MHPVTCGYDGSTKRTFDLFSLTHASKIGQVDIEIHAKNLVVKIRTNSPCKISSARVLLSNKLFKNIFLSRFTCFHSGSKNSKLEFVCPLSRFLFRCCGPLRVYVNALTVCRRSIISAFAGSPSCKNFLGKQVWNVPQLAPPCTSCGACDDTQNRCVSPSTICSDSSLYCNPAAKVCTKSQCIPKKTCPHGTCNAGDPVCDPQAECDATCCSNTCPNCHRSIPGSCGCEIDPHSANDCNPCGRPRTANRRAANQLCRALSGVSSSRCCRSSSRCRRFMLANRAVRSVDPRTIICSPRRCNPFCDTITSNGNTICTIGRAPIPLHPKEDMDGSSFASSIELCSTKSD